MSNFIRTLVSKEKKRFEEGEYNLDLSYITDRIIAMGFPASSFEAIYRNPLDAVKKFLEDRHKDRYRLYNLCSERSYDIGKFQNRVAFYPFDDHNPPEFSQMKPFCEDVDRWLGENPENIAVVHCKAGKGRTGLMICAYLLHSQHEGMTTSDQVLKFYAEKRTQNDKGVTIPSQRRYVDYYAAMIKDRLQFSPVKLYLHSFVIDPVPNLGLNQSDSFINFEVRQKCVRQYTSEVFQVKKTDSPITIKLREPLLLIDDVRIDVLQSPDLFGSKKFPKFQKLKFHFWVNTYFIDQERSSELSHTITEATPEQIFHLTSLPPTLRSTHLTHESLTSRPSLPTTSAAAAAAASVSPTAASTTWSQQKLLSTSTMITSYQTRMTTSVIGTNSTTSTIAHSDPPDSPTQERKCRSEHNSGEMGGSGGGCGGASDPVPLPGHLRPNRSDPATHVTASDDTLDTRSPNGSFVPNLTSIPPNYRIPRNVTVVDPAQQGDANCDIFKTKCVSDDTLTDQNPMDATQSAFNIDHDRKRHRSVPMMGKPSWLGGATPPHFMSRPLQGKMMSVRLKKHQIDDADKDKGKRFADNFNVTLFLIRPSNQTLEEEFLRPNSIAQHAETGCCYPPQHLPHNNRIPSYRRFPPPDSSDEDDEFDDIRRQDDVASTTGLQEGEDGELTPHQQWNDEVFPPASSSLCPPSPSSAPASSAGAPHPDLDILVGGDSVSASGVDELHPSSSAMGVSSLSVVGQLACASSTEALPSATAQPVHVSRQQTDSQSLSGMVRNQTEPCRELCRVSSQTTWI